MKFRTDFVTNSSSSGFVCVYIELRDNDHIELNWEYHTGYGGYFRNGFVKEEMEDQLRETTTGDDLLDLLGGTIDSFNMMLSEDKKNGGVFEAKLSQLGSVDSVKSIHISEATYYDMGGEDECNFDYIFLTSDDIVKESQKTKKRINTLENQRVYLYGQFDNAKKEEIIKKIKQLKGSFRTEKRIDNIELIIISGASLDKESLHDPWLIDAYQRIQNKSGLHIITENDFIVLDTLNQTSFDSLRHQETPVDFHGPFIPVEGQGYNERSIVYADIIQSFFDEMYWELFYFRAFVTMIIDSMSENQVKLLSKMISSDFADRYAQSLDENKQPDGFKKAVHEGERYIWFPHFLRIALLLTLSNDSLFKRIAENCLGDLTEFTGSEKQCYQVPDGFNNVGIIRMLLTYMDLIPGSDDDIKEIFFSSMEKNQLVKDLLELMLIKYSTDDIVRFFCGTFHLTESQFEIRQFGATKIGSSDSRFTLLKNEYNELTIISYKGPGGSVSIPESIDGYPVTSIFSYAFSTESSPRWTGGGGCHEPPLSYRKNSQFSEHYEEDQYNCMQIEELLIPNSIREIGERAFYGGLPKIKHLSIPEAVASIPDIWSFKSLQRLDLPEQAYRFTGNLFQIYDCPELQYIKLPKGINEYCCVRIESCMKLEYIEMPDYLPRIYGIRNCPVIRELFLPIDRFEQMGFEGCTSLTDVYFPNLKYAFKNGFDPKQIAHLTIHGYPKSYAEKYAKRIGAKFVPDCSPEKKKELDDKYRQLYGTQPISIKL